VARLRERRSRSPWRRCTAGEVAEAEEVVAMLAVLNASGNWRAPAWLLERRFPRLYGRRVREVVTEQPIALRVEIMSKSSSGAVTEQAT
jgi:hypothetical protein